MIEEQTMDKTLAKARIEELRRILDYNAKLYYEKDAPEISDYEYDMMFRELGDLEREFPELDSPTSITKRVGGRALDKFEKQTHLPEYVLVVDNASTDGTKEYLAEWEKKETGFMHRVISPAEKKTYEYREKSIVRRFFANDRARMLSEVGEWKL